MNEAVSLFCKYIYVNSIVKSPIKEILDYYLRLEVAELEGDLFKVSKKGDAEKLARIYKKLVAAKAELSDWENA